MYVLLSALSALFYGIADFSGGFAARRSALPAVLAVSQAAGASLALFFILASGAGPARLPDLAWGLVAGLSGLVGLFILYRGIATGIVALVSPVSALVSALIPAIFGVVLGERPSLPAVAGMVLCLPAMLLLSWEPPGAIDPAKARSSVLNGLVAGTGFGFFFVALSRTSADAGLWPVFAARLSSFSVVLVYALVTGSRISIARGGRSLTLLAGLADMGANILFLLASRSGLLSLVAMISSLFPAPTVILARIFMKESIPPARAAGLGLALGGIALISLH